METAGTIRSPVQTASPPTVPHITLSGHIWIVDTGVTATQTDTQQKNKLRNFCFFISPENILNQCVGLNEKTT